MTRDMTGRPSRRDFARGLFLAGGGAVAAGPLLAAARRPTPAEIVARITAQCAREGVAWSAQTVDTFKIGATDTPVTGVISTFMATLDLMRRAVAARANFIVSHEPIFYNHTDDVAALQADPVYQAKVRYATQHGLTVWRFHDHWHRLTPEPMSSASMAVLGWEPYLDAGSAGFSRTFTRPPITLSALVAEMTAKLPSRSIRVIGDPTLTVTKIADIGHSIDGLVKALDHADVAIGPEVREWDSGEYVRDQVALGARKALILIAHERAEEAGMERCRDWLTKLVPEVPVTFIPSGEPFRTARWA